MHLEDARRLKLEIKGQFEKSTAARRGPFRDLVQRLGIRRPMGTPAVAGGIGVRDHGEYRVAIRIQDPKAAASLGVREVGEHAGDDVDVRYIGELHRFQAPWQRQRQRPLVMGATVGHPAATAGTIGAFVRTADGRPAILSNNHVLANVNDASEGDPVLQPGRLDGGGAADRVATLRSFVPLRAGVENFVDAAIATLDDGIEYDAVDIQGLGALAGTRSPYEAQHVSKCGRTTGTTAGFISAVEIDYAVVSFGPGRFMPFDDQIEIQSLDDAPFSQLGDSGSLVVDTETMGAVGLRFAGNDATGVTYASPIDRVLGELGVTLP